MAPTLFIGSHALGSDRPAYVIAEAGVNHNGDVGRALRLVDVAVAAGANAVKFQLFTPEELVVSEAPIAKYQAASGAADQRQMLAGLTLRDEEFLRIAAHCRDRSIDFLATPFTIHDLERLRQFTPPAVKIASTDLTNWQLLQRAALGDEPLILSTGAATATEIERTVSWLHEWQAAERAVLLHCISSYPTPLPSVNLRVMQTLAERFSLPVGFSDHTRSVETGGWAVALGAWVVEKHFTLDTSDAGPDHAMSLSPEGLRVYVAAIRAFEVARGAGEPGLDPLEREVRAIAGKSIYAARALTPGTRLTEQELAVRRPAAHLPAADFPRLVGRTVKRAVAAGAPLHQDDLA